jgi:hypothetical protein
MSDFTRLNEIVLTHVLRTTDVTTATNAAFVADDRAIRYTVNLDLLANGSGAGSFALKIQYDANNASNFANPVDLPVAGYQFVDATTGKVNRGALPSIVSGANAAKKFQFHFDKVPAPITAGVLPKLMQNYRLVVTPAGVAGVNNITATLIECVDE